MLAEVPEAERVTRSEMIQLANGYFETIERNNGMIRTRFHPHCNRVENGVQTTNNEDFPCPSPGSAARPSSRSAGTATTTSTRRRFPLVDIERGYGARARLHRPLGPTRRVRADRRHQGVEPDPPAAHLLPCRGVQDQGRCDRAGRGGVPHGAVPDAVALGGATNSDEWGRSALSASGEREGAPQARRERGSRVPLSQPSPLKGRGRSITPTRRIPSLVLLGGVFVMEGFDIAAMSIAVPRLEGALGLAPPSFGWVFTASWSASAARRRGDCAAGRPVRAADADRRRVPRYRAGHAGHRDSHRHSSVSRLAPPHRPRARRVPAECQRASAELAPERLRATIMAVVSAGIPVCLALAGFLAPQIIARAAWPGPVPGSGHARGRPGLGLWLASYDTGGAPVRAEAAGAKPTATKLPQLQLFGAPWRFPVRGFRHDARAQCAQSLPAQFVASRRCCRRPACHSTTRRAWPGWPTSRGSRSGSARAC